MGKEEDMGKDDAGMAARGPPPIIGKEEARLGGLVPAIPVLGASPVRPDVVDMEIGAPRLACSAACMITSAAACAAPILGGGVKVGG